MAEKPACSAMTDDARDGSMRVTNHERFARVRTRAAKHALRIVAGAIALAAVATSPAAMAEAPMFSDDMLMRMVVENTPPNTNIGAVIPSATDTDDGDTLTYTMEGTNADAFEFDGASRQIKTRDALDFETKASYSVTIKVTDSTSNTDTVDVIIDVTDEFEPPTVTIIGGSANEGDDVTFTITLSEASSQGATVSWDTSTTAEESTASTNDLSGTTSGTVTFGAGETSKTVTISTVEDMVYEANETFMVTLTGGTDADVGTPSEATGTINNDEALPTFTLVLQSTTIQESDDPGMSGDQHRTTMTPTLDIAVQGEVSATVTTNANELRHGSPLGTMSTLEIAAGQLTGSTQVVEAVDNDTDAPDRRATITVEEARINDGPLDGQALDRGTNPTITITDDDEAPTVSLSLGPGTIRESDDTSTTDVSEHVSTVSARLSHPSNENTSVTVSGEAVSPAVAGDFAVSSNKLLTITAGETRSTGTVTVTAVDNNTDARNKEVTVSATATNTQGVAGDPGAQTLAIRDDEETPRVLLVLGSNSISEASGTTTVHATIPHASSHETTVTVTPVENAFTVSGTLTITAGSTQSATATLTAVDNDTDADDRTVTVHAVATNSQGVVQPIGQTLTITDDDPAPTVTLVLEPPSIDESGGTSTTTVTATLDHPSSKPTEVRNGPRWTVG